MPHSHVNHLWSREMATTNLYSFVKVFASRKTADEKQRVNLVINLLSLILDQIKNLQNDGIEDFSTQKYARNCQFAIDKANGWVVGILDVESGEMKHIILIPLCRNTESCKK
jgi:hypothetical protein